MKIKYKLQENRVKKRFSKGAGPIFATYASVQDRPWDENTDGLVMLAKEEYFGYDNWPEDVTEHIIEGEFIDDSDSYPYLRIFSDSIIDVKHELFKGGSSAVIYEVDSEGNILEKVGEVKKFPENLERVSTVKGDFDTRSAEEIDINSNIYESIDSEGQKWYNTESYIYILYKRIFYFGSCDNVPDKVKDIKKLDSKYVSRYSKELPYDYSNIKHKYLVIAYPKEVGELSGIIDSDGDNNLNLFNKEEIENMYVYSTKFKINLKDNFKLTFKWEG